MSGIVDKCLDTYILNLQSLKQDDLFNRGTRKQKHSESIINAIKCVSTVNDNKSNKFAFYEHDKFFDEKNQRISLSTIRFIKDAQKFDDCSLMKLLWISNNSYSRYWYSLILFVKELIIVIKRQINEVVIINRRNEMGDIF